MKNMQTINFAQKNLSKKSSFNYLKAIFQTKITPPIYISADTVRYSYIKGS